MRNLFSKPMGALGAPIGAPDRRFIDMGVSDTMPILGGFMSMIGQLMTNDSNEHIAAQTNKTNREINDQQLAWARENYELEKEENRYLVDQAYQRSLADRENERAYQSYKNQIKLMREAGINPALMLSGSSAGHAGASASTYNTVGSPARHNQPSMIPMQKSVPMQNALDDFGMGIAGAQSAYLARKASMREDYRLANDITATLTGNRIKFLEALTAAKKAGVDVDRLGFDKDRFERTMALEEDKFAREIEVANEELKLKTRQVVVSELEANIKAAQVQINARMSNAQIQYLSDVIANEMSRIGIEKANSETYASEVANNVIHLINSDANAYEALGMERELLTSKKFHNWISGITEGVTAGAILGFGLKGARGAKPISGFK